MAQDKLIPGVKYDVINSVCISGKMHRERDMSKDDADIPIRGVQVTVLGPCWAGKSCLVHTFFEQAYPSVHPYPATVRDIYSVLTKPEQEPVRLNLIDFGDRDQKGFRVLRQLSYRNTDVFVLCFAVDERDTLPGLHEWFQEIRHSSLDAPIVIVACKIDVRHADCDQSNAINTNGQVREQVEIQEANQHVTHLEGDEFAHELNCTYIETSALTGRGVTSCFSYTIHLALRYQEWKISEPFVKTRWRGTWRRIKKDRNTKKRKTFADTMVTPEDDSTRELLSNYVDNTSSDVVELKQLST